MAVGWGRESTYGDTRIHISLQSFSNSPDTEYPLP